MNNKQTKSILIGICATILTVLACSLGNVNTTILGTATTTGTATPAESATPIATVAPTSEATINVTPTEAPGTPTPAAVKTSRPSASATPEGVVITATKKGSIGILRGTSLSYDTLGYLKPGQHSIATARNSDGSWLYIYVPNYPSVYGWAWAGSVYSTVTGDVKSLPIKTVDPAVPAYIRNCTFDPMIIKPGNVLLQPQTDTVNNKKQFNPGTYTAIDQGSLVTPTMVAVSTGTPTAVIPSMGNPQVLTITLKEGVSVDIKKDAYNNTYSCP